MGAPSGEDRKFLNYPAPITGLEHFAFLRRSVWQNTGFHRLRDLKEYIENVEPRFNPCVIRLPSEQDRKVTPPVPEPIPTKNSDVEEATSSPSTLYYSSADYHRKYLTGKLTPTAVAKALLPLIRRDTVPPGPYSKAWHETRIDLVLAAAEASTLRYQNKCPIGPLDGVPTGVKDDYDIEGYRTNLGSKNDYTGQSTRGTSVTSWCVKKIEEAGAVIMGKLTMPEFGMDTNGNNPVYGTPLNPYNSNFYTGGSSSGPAYAVSTGLVPFALGGDGGGSIRIPASFCSVYGIKPSHDRVSSAPSANHANTCAVNGPIACDIRTLTTVYEVLSIPHPSSDFPPVSPIALHLSAPGSSSKPKFLGIPEAWIAQSTPRTQTLVMQMVTKLVATKNYVVVPIRIPFLPEGQLAHAMTMLTDAATLLPSTHNITAPNKVLVALGRTTLSTDYLLAQKLRHLLMRHLAYLWSLHPGMVIVTPTTACEGWKIRNLKEEERYGISDGDTTLETMRYVWMANFCGVPSIVCPVGFGGEGVVEGSVPIGMMGMGEWGDEEGLLQWGLEVESLSAGVAGVKRRPPIWVDVMERAVGNLVGGVEGWSDGDVRGGDGGDGDESRLVDV